MVMAKEKGWHVQKNNGKNTKVNVVEENMKNVVSPLKAGLSLRASYSLQNQPCLGSYFGSSVNNKIPM